MTRWRFYPLAEYPRTGVLVSPERKPSVATHLTLEEAKRKAELRKAEAA